MPVGAIIFSRHTSFRLPGKALLDIYGRCLLGRVIDRSKHIEGVDKLIIATSIDVEDDSIVKFAEAEGIDVFRGSLDNVVERALAACECFNLTRFARIFGDRPFFDPELVSSLIQIHSRYDLDLATTTFPNTFAPGLAAEVINTEALRRINGLFLENEDREHVTKYFYSHAKDFKIKNIENSSNIDMEGLHLAVDDKDDLKRARWIASQLNKDSEHHFSMKEIILHARNWANLNQRKTL